MDGLGGVDELSHDLFSYLYSSFWTLTTGVAMARSQVVATLTLAAVLQHLILTRCNTRSQVLNHRVATSRFDSLQHPVSRSQPPCCNIPSRLVATPVSSRCNTPSQLHCKTSRFGSTTVLQHPVCVAIPHLNPPCKLQHLTQPATLQHPVSTHRVAIPGLNLPCCNTQPTTLQSTVSTFNHRVATPF